MNKLRFITDDIKELKEFKVKLNELVENHHHGIYLIDDIFYYIGQINKTLDYVVTQDEVNK
mgnify:FL=1|tara:strand:- start:246 stop:428 length:183 start_codon:yes stop_codon:yes gene_type:complete